MDRRKLTDALFRLKQTDDFKTVIEWLYETRDAYLQLWKTTEKLEHFQGRYGAVDDMVIFIEKAEELLARMRAQDKEQEQESPRVF